MKRSVQIFSASYILTLKKILADAVSTYSAYSNAQDLTPILRSLTFDILVLRPNCLVGLWHRKNYLEFCVICPNSVTVLLTYLPTKQFPNFLHNMWKKSRKAVNSFWNAKRTVKRNFLDQKLTHGSVISLLSLSK